MKQIQNILGANDVSMPSAQTQFRTAKLAAFHSPRARLLFGKHIKDMSKLEASIQENGLMRPLSVSRSDGKYIVLDGHKRLLALRRLKFRNALPRSLVNIPYVLDIEDAPHLLSAQERNTEMNRLREDEKSITDIAAELCTNAEDIHALQSLDRLSPRVKAAFDSHIITLTQAQAFASLAWPEAQDSLLLNVGPSASVNVILSKIEEILRAGNRNSRPENRDDNVIRMPVPPLKDVRRATLTDSLDFAA